MIVYKVVHKRDDGRYESAITGNKEKIMYPMGRYCGVRTKTPMLAFSDIRYARKFKYSWHDKQRRRELVIVEARTKDEYIVPIHKKRSVITYGGDNSYGWGNWPSGTIAVTKIKLIKEVK